MILNLMPTHFETAVPARLLVTVYDLLFAFVPWHPDQVLFMMACAGF